MEEEEIPQNQGTNRPAPSVSDTMNGIPEDIVFKSQIFAVDFHPTLNVFGVGLISGFVKLFRYAGEEGMSSSMNTGESTLLHQIHPHKKSCRSLAFSSDGRILYSAGSDKKLLAIDVETGKLLHSIQAAHPDPINVLCISQREPFLFSGDDVGRIKIWDTKTANCVHEFSEHHDFISSMQYHENKRVLVCGGGDGCLSGWNIGKMDVDGISANLDDEILSLAIIKEKSQVVCGTQGGIVHLWKFGEWEEPIGSYRGHPESIDAMELVDQNTIVTGSSDGILRIVQLVPHKIIGVIGDNGGLPVERVKTSHDHKILASFSHDSTLRFWDVSQLYSDSGDDTDDENEEKPKETPSTTTTTNNNNNNAPSISPSMINDVESDEGDEDGNEVQNMAVDSSSSIPKPHKKRISKKAFFSGL